MRNRYNNRSILRLSTILFEKSDSQGLVRNLTISQIKESLGLSLRQVYNVLKKVEKWKDKPFTRMSNQGSHQGNVYQIHAQHKFFSSCAPITRARPGLSPNTTKSTSALREPSVKGKRLILFKVRLTLSKLTQGKTELTDKLTRFFGKMLWKQRHTWHFWKTLHSRLHQFFQHFHINELTDDENYSYTKSLVHRWIRTLILEAKQNTDRALQQQHHEQELKRSEQIMNIDRKINHKMTEAGIKIPQVSQFATLNEYINALEVFHVRRQDFVQST